MYKTLYTSNLVSSQTYPEERESQWLTTPRVCRWETQVASPETLDNIPKIKHRQGFIDSKMNVDTMDLLLHTKQNRFILNVLWKMKTRKWQEKLSVYVNWNMQLWWVKRDSWITMIHLPRWWRLWWYRNAMKPTEFQLNCS